MQKSSRVLDVKSELQIIVKCKRVYRQRVKRESPPRRHKKCDITKVMMEVGLLEIIKINTNVITFVDRECNEFYVFLFNHNS